MASVTGLNQPIEMYRGVGLIAAYKKEGFGGGGGGGASRGVSQNYLEIFHFGIP